MIQRVVIQLAVTALLSYVSEYEIRPNLPAVDRQFADVPTALHLMCSECERQ